MPRLIDGEGRTNEIVRGICRLILREGLEGITLRKIAREVGISAGTINHHYESRDRLMIVAVHTFMREFVTSSEQRLRVEGVRALLPSTSSDLGATRVWLAMAELGRSHPIIGRDVSDARARERWALSVSRTPALGVRDAHASYAAVDGLRVAVCATHDPIPLELARELLEGAIDRTRPAA